MSQDKAHASSLFVECVEYCSLDRKVPQVLLTSIGNVTKGAVRKRKPSEENMNMLMMDKHRTLIGWPIIRALHPSYSLFAPRRALTVPLTADTLRERPARLCLPQSQGEGQEEQDWVPET